MAYPSTNLPRITFRLPEKLRDRLEDSAKRNNRSVNAEIVERLDLSFLHEVEGRDSDAASLRNEVMELRYAMLSLVQAFISKDKGEIEQAVGNMLEGYQQAMDEMRRQAGAAADDGTAG